MSKSLTKRLAVSKASKATARDAQYMALALELAHRGHPSPNPHVGAVIVKGGKVIARGHHERAGLAHAEVDALSRAKGSLRGATLYVTLEPCNHHGRTPPCTDAIIASGIKRVVVGALDPKPHVPGAIRKLRRAGIQVITGVMQPECETLIEDFAHHVTTGMPFVHVKAAITLDGKIATSTRDAKWITSKDARVEAHRLRAESDAVLVGVETVLADDPALTVRHVRGDNPVRIVLDTSLRTPAHSQLLIGPTPTWLIHAPCAERVKQRFRRYSHVQLIEVPMRGTHLSLPHALREIGKRDIVRMLVEGGARVHGALLDARLVQRISLFVAPKILGDARAPSWAGGHGAKKIAGALDVSALQVTRIGPDLWLQGRLATAAKGT